MKSDILIIGGGASGLMAALGAAGEYARNGNYGNITVLEKMPKTCRKLMLTGRGRCNCTNVKDWDAFSEHIRTDEKFVSPAWHNFTPQNVLDFFKENGVKTVVERGDRAFPASHLSGDIADALLRACTLAGVKVVTGCEVKEIDKTPKGFSVSCVLTSVKQRRAPRDEKGGFQPQPKPEVTLEHVDYSATKLIIACGGMSYPGTGSTGDGYVWAEELGHEIVDCYPALTALVPKGYKDPNREVKRGGRFGGRSEGRFGGRSEGRFGGRSEGRFGDRSDARKEKINPLPSFYPKLNAHIERITPMSELGEMFNDNTLDNVGVTLYVNGNPVQNEFGDIEFTDGGMEGPLGFIMSRKGVKALIAGEQVEVAIDLKPAVELEKLNEDIHSRWEEIVNDGRSKGLPFQKLFRVLLGKLMPWKLVPAFLRYNSRVSIDSLASALKNWVIPIEGFVGYERAVITAGGVSTKDVIAKTLESRKTPGLYFCGEVLDMDADTGGYNLQLAFSTGYLAGQSAVKALSE